mgnify:CR=1 FL=1
MDLIFSMKKLISITLATSLAFLIACGSADSYRITKTEIENLPKAALKCDVTQFVPFMTPVAKRHSNDFQSLVDRAEVSRYSISTNLKKLFGNHVAIREDAFRLLIYGKNPKNLTTILFITQSKNHNYILRFTLSNN